MSPTAPNLTANQSANSRFTLVVQDSGQAARLAQRFIIATRTANHAIEQVFFYHDGVFEADANRTPAQDDPEPVQSWQTLAREGSFALNVCIAASARRGVLSESEAERHGKPAANLAPEFELVGLGVLIEGLMNADRVITFGNGN